LGSFGNLVASLAAAALGVRVRRDARKRRWVRLALSCGSGAAGLFRQNGFERPAPCPEQPGISRACSAKALVGEACRGGFQTRPYRSSGCGHAAISGIGRIESSSSEFALLACTRLIATERDCPPQRALILQYSRKDFGTGAAHAHDLDLRRRNLQGQVQALRLGLRSRDGLRQSGDLLCQYRIARGRPAQAVALGILRRACFAFGCLRAAAPAAVPAAGLPPRFSYRAAGTFVWLAHLLPSCSLFVLTTNPRQRYT
jgi:hypothetical protein